MRPLYPLYSVQRVLNVFFTFISFRPAQLNLTIVNAKLTSEGNSFISLCQGHNNKMFVWQGPIRAGGNSPKIIENRAICDGRGSPPARVRTHIVGKSPNHQKNTRHLRRFSEV